MSHQQNKSQQELKNIKDSTKNEKVKEVIDKKLKYFNRDLKK